MGDLRRPPKWLRVSYWLPRQANLKRGAPKKTKKQQRTRPPMEHPFSLKLWKGKSGDPCFSHSFKAMELFGGSSANFSSSGPIWPERLITWVCLSIVVLKGSQTENRCHFEGPLKHPVEQFHTWQGSRVICIPSFPGRGSLQKVGGGGGLTTIFAQADVFKNSTWGKYQYGTAFGKPGVGIIPKRQMGNHQIS